MVTQDNVSSKMIRYVYLQGATNRHSLYKQVIGGETR